MDQEKTLFYENQDESYSMVDLYLNHTFFVSEDSYNYYDIDVDKILLYEKSDNKYCIRYNDVNKIKVVPLQLELNYFFGDMYTFTNNDRIMFIKSNEKELFKKFREIWNKITELIGINNAPDFVKNTIDDVADEFITVDIPKNRSITDGNYRNKLVIFLHSVINNYLKTSLVHSLIMPISIYQKINNQCAYTLIIIKNFLLLFFNVYKNEQKEYKF